MHSVIGIGVAGGLHLRSGRGGRRGFGGKVAHTGDGNQPAETEVLLDAAAARQVPVLLTLTSAVYGKSQKAAFSEEDGLFIGPPNQVRWSYAYSKLVDEFLALAYAKERALPVVFTRLFNTFGPRQTGRHGMVLPRFIGAARSGAPLRVFGDGRQSRCFCYVPDTVEALVRLQNSAAALGEVFNVGGAEEITILDLARWLSRHSVRSRRLSSTPIRRPMRLGFEDMRRRKPVTEKRARVTGFWPVNSLHEIVQRTASAG